VSAGAPDVGGAGRAPGTDPEVPLARLFAMAYRQLVDALHEELPRRGWTDVRPAFGFVLLALRDGPASLRDLPGVLGTSKQAVSKLVDAMVVAGYVERAAHPGDARAKRVALSARGRDLLAAVEEIHGELEHGWAEVLGDQRLADLRGALTTALKAAHGGTLPAVRTMG
jgi:DNA-binding MarR family transcriptional regulator